MEAPVYTVLAKLELLEPVEVTDLPKEDELEVLMDMAQVKGLQQVQKAIDLDKEARI